MRQTVYAATQDLGERLRDTDDEGADLDSDTYLIRPPTFLSWVTLVSFLVPEAVSSRAKQRSFELYRRNLYEPEILTFDELLARAEWLLAEAEGT